MEYKYSNDNRVLENTIKTWEYHLDKSSFFFGSPANPIQGEWMAIKI